MHAIADLCRWQAPYCRRLGSPLYGELLECAAADIDAGGPLRNVFRGHEDDPPGSMPQLRLLGAVHRLVLSGEASELEPFYPSVGGRADGDPVWAVFRAVVAGNVERLREELRAPVQTNEVGRCAGLLGGFLLVARATGLPLRILEVGASAGLNLRFDSYRYSQGEATWGPADSPVRFAGFSSEGRLPLEVEATVAERRGCDAHPLDPTSERDRLILRGFVWPDQEWRFEPLSRALDVLRAAPVPVEQADAAEWAALELARPAEGVATVLFHSLVLHFMSDDTSERFLEAVHAAGERATPDAPLAWLRMEIGGEQADVRLARWPGGEDRLIARAGYHGRPVEWLA